MINSTAPLRVLAVHRPPLVFADKEGLFTGFLVDLLPALLRQAKVEVAYNIFNFTGSGGTLRENGSWSGVMGELTEGRADLALFPLTLTSQRDKAIQHTTAYLDDGYAILARVHTSAAGYGGFLMPFEGLTWAMFLCAMLAVVMLLTLMDLVTRRMRQRAINRTELVCGQTKRRRRDKVMDHTIEAVMMAVGSGSAPSSRSWGVKILFIAWAIFCVIMLSAYTANLATLLMVNQMALPIRSLADLAASPAYFGVPSQSSVATYFSNSSDTAARRLRPKMVEYKSTAEGAAAVRAGDISAFIGDYPVMQYFTQTPPCDLALAQETIGSGSLVIGLAPNSSLAGALNEALLVLSEAGFLADLRRKWFVEASQCNAAEGNSMDSDSSRLAVSQVWSVFLLLGIGAAVAIVVTAIEVCYYKKMFAGMQRFKLEVASFGPKEAVSHLVARRSRVGKTPSQQKLQPPGPGSHRQSGFCDDIESAAGPAGGSSQSSFSTSGSSNAAAAVIDAHAVLDAQLPAGGKDASLPPRAPQQRQQPSGLQVLPQPAFKGSHVRAGAVPVVATSGAQPARGHGRRSHKSTSSSDSD